MNQRLGVVVYIAPKIIFNKENMFGFLSADLVVDYIQENILDVPDILIKVLPLMIDDVYWVAMYLYYGVIGFSLYALFLISIYKKLTINKHNFRSPLIQQLYLVSISLLLIAMPLNFINQALVTRTFSFYLWLFIGLTLTFSRDLKTKNGLMIYENNIGTQ